MSTTMPGQEVIFRMVPTAMPEVWRVDIYSLQQVSSAPAERPSADAGGGKLALERSEKSAPSCTALDAKPERTVACRC